VGHARDLHLEEMVTEHPASEVGRMDAVFSGIGDSQGIQLVGEGIRHGPVWPAPRHVHGLGPGLLVPAPVSKSGATHAVDESPCDHESRALRVTYALPRHINGLQDPSK